MKIFSSIIILIISGFCFQNMDNYKPQTWRLNLITLNSDTIFYYNEPRFTNQYNYNINKATIKNEADSLWIQRIAIKNYNESKKMVITFNTDTTFLMTKLRSGGRIFPLEKDTGTYTIRRDTIFMTNRTRNDYKLWFVQNKLDDKIFYSNDTPNHKIYWEYKKEK